MKVAIGGGVLEPEGVLCRQCPGAANPPCRLQFCADAQKPAKEPPSPRLHPRGLTLSSELLSLSSRLLPTVLVLLIIRIVLVRKEDDGDLSDITIRCLRPVMQPSPMTRNTVELEVQSGRPSVGIIT